MLAFKMTTLTLCRKLFTCSEIQHKKHIIYWIVFHMRSYTQNRVLLNWSHSSGNIVCSLTNCLFVLHLWLWIKASAKRINVNVNKHEIKLTCILNAHSVILNDVSLLQRKCFVLINQNIIACFSSETTSQCLSIIEILLSFFINI